MTHQSNVVNNIVALPVKTETRMLSLDVQLPFVKYLFLYYESIINLIQYKTRLKKRISKI